MGDSPHISIGAGGGDSQNGLLINSLRFHQFFPPLDDHVFVRCGGVDRSPGG